MQKGLATIEIILAVMVIGVLMKFAVPKASSLIDTVALDYETKRFYSELQFVQAMGRSTPNVIKGVGEISLVTSESTPILFINRTENYYQVFKNTERTQAIREPHYFSNGVTIKLESGTDPTITIGFDAEGKAKINTNNSDTLVLTSRLGKKKGIVIDSVGRIKGALDN